MKYLSLLLLAGMVGCAWGQGAMETNSHESIFIRFGSNIFMSGEAPMWLTPAGTLCFRARGIIICVNGPQLPIPSALRRNKWEH